MTDHNDVEPRSTKRRPAAPATRVASAGLAIGSTALMVGAMAYSDFAFATAPTPDSATPAVPGDAGEPPVPVGLASNVEDRSADPGPTFVLVPPPRPEQVPSPAPQQRSSAVSSGAAPGLDPVEATRAPAPARPAPTAPPAQSNASR